MIYCIELAEIERFLLTLGYARVPSEAEHHALFINPDSAVVTIRFNHRGHTPEYLANLAFEVAGIEPARWNLFWCD